VVPVALAAGWLLACRAIIGVEDLELVHDGGVDAHAADGGVKDGATNTGTDAATGQVDSTTKIAECIKPGVDCRRCCKTAFGDFTDAENSETTRKCMCRPEHCQDKCGDASDYCGGGRPSEGCAPCLDDEHIKNQCNEACTSAGCLAGLSCLQQCP
jgi:hypothetical protein